MNPKDKRTRLILFKRNFLFGPRQPRVYAPPARLQLQFRTPAISHSKRHHSWKHKFVHDCEVRKDQVKRAWEHKWVEDCDGKLLFRDLHQKIPFKMSLERFKKRVMRKMRIDQRKNWREIEALLKGLIR
jgi:hypothetical protein